MNFKISIGIPVFKGRFLANTIRSVLSQTYRNFEIIIVNDCSPDNIEAIMENFKDEKINYFVNPSNVGSRSVVENWNNCLAKATGKYFVLLGDDDVLQPNYLEEFHKLILKYPDLNVFHCRAYIINEMSDPLYVTPSWPEYESVFENIWHRVSGYRIQFISDFLYATTALKDSGGFVELPLAWGSDDLTSYCIAEKKGIAHTNEIIFNYRQNAHSITNSGDVKLKLTAVYSHKKWLYNFLKIESDSMTDKIFRKAILLELPRYYKKQKIMVMANAYKVSFWKNIFSFFFSGAKYGVSLSDIFMSVLEFLKFKWVQINRIDSLIKND